MFDSLERFLRYVRIDTQSAMDAECYPSTAKQLNLARVLVEELNALGMADVRLDEHGYVTATCQPTFKPPRRWSAFWRIWTPAQQPLVKT